jgi:hypothetical protein
VRRLIRDLAPKVTWRSPMPWMNGLTKLPVPARLKRQRTSSPSGARARSNVIFSSTDEIYGLEE